MPQGAVKTELGATESVQQGAPLKDEPVRYDVKGNARDTAQRLAALRGFIEKNYEFDVAAREIVYRAVDTRTGEVVRQFPDDVALKLRSFVKEINDKQRGDGGYASDVRHVTRLA